MFWEKNKNPSVKFFTLPRINSNFENKYIQETISKTSFLLEYVNPW